MLYTDVKNEFIENQRVNSISPKSYLPIRQKLSMVNDIINDASYESDYIIPINLDVYSAIHIMINYYDIELSDEQKTVDGLPELYDDMISSGLYNYLYNRIVLSERQIVDRYITETAAAVERYNNSALGIVRLASKDYGNFAEKAQDVLKNIGEQENFTVLREIAPLLDQN